MHSSSRSDRHVFATLTYGRDQSEDDTWHRVPRDFNRFLQKVRRTTGHVEYLRCTERHKDGYPHMHVLLQYRDVYFSNSYRGRTYLPRPLFDSLKLCWTQGHTDYQVPRRKGLGTVGYILKYISKGTSSKTVWRKVLGQRSATTVDPLMSLTAPTPSKERYQLTAEMLASMHTSTVETAGSHSTKPALRYKGVKLLTWSRHLDWTAFRRV